MAEFFVQPTEDRAKAEGEYILQISRAGLRQAGIKERSKYAVAAYGSRAALAKLVNYERLPDHAARLDQTIRERIGLGRNPPVGATISVFPVQGKIHRIPFFGKLFQPRTLALSAVAEIYQQIEKNVSFLHPLNIRVLGVQEGDKIVIWGLKKDVKSGEFRIARLNRRVLSRECYTPRSNPVGRDMTDLLSIDLDGRRRLGIKSEAIVWVQPDVGNLFWSRLVQYGIVLLLSALSLQTILESVTWVPFSWGVTALAATLITFVVIIFDLRARINY